MATPGSSKRPLEVVAADQETKRQKVEGREGNGTSDPKKKEEKGKKNGKDKNLRRDRRGTRGTREVGSGDDGNAAEGEKKARLPKRNCAVLIGFCGTGCYGMQMCVEFFYDAY